MAALALLAALAGRTALGIIGSIGSIGNIGSSSRNPISISSSNSSSSSIFVSTAVDEAYVYTSRLASLAVVLTLGTNGHHWKGRQQWATLAALGLSALLSVSRPVDLPNQPGSQWKSQTDRYATSLRLGRPTAPRPGPSHEARCRCLPSGYDDKPSPVKVPSAPSAIAARVTPLRAEPSSVSPCVLAVEPSHLTHMRVTYAGIMCDVAHR
jgi:hypothetical protein